MSEKLDVDVCPCLLLLNFVIGLHLTTFEFCHLLFSIFLVSRVPKVFINFCKGLDQGFPYSLLKSLSNLTIYK
jgi:hypothetical protein